MVLRFLTIKATIFETHGRWQNMTEHFVFMESLGLHQNDCQEDMIFLEKSRFNNF
jgi:hypothetical protein